MPASSPSGPEPAANDAGVADLIAELREHNPAVARLYRDATRHTTEGTLTDPERALVLLTVSRHDDSAYGRSVHAERAVAAGLPREVVKTVDRGGLPTERRPRVLVQATRLLLEKYGWLDEADLDSLERNGVGRAALYEISALVGLASVGNAVAHVARAEDSADSQRN